MKKILSIFLLLNMLFLSGCWDSREINEVGLVMAVGIDRAEDSDDFVVTVQIANPKPVAASKEKAISAEPIWVISSIGPTIFEAIREMSKVSSKRIVWGHNNIVIIGESLAKDDIGPVIDYFTHNPELRMKAAVVVSKGNAKDYVGSKAGMEDVPGISLSNLMSYSTLTTDYVQSNMLLLSQEYFAEYKQPILTTIQFKDDKIMPSDGRADKTVETINMSGTAVFNKGKMIGMLTREETRGFTWVNANIKNTLVTVNYGNQDKISLEMKGFNVKVNTQINQGVPSVSIAVLGNAEIVEEDGTSDLSIEDFKMKVGDLVNQKITDEINTCLTVVQKEYKVDTFCFAKYFHAQQNEEWENSIGKHWEEIYPDISIDVSCNIDIIGSTLNQIPANAATRYGEQ